jgi:hypothetical protein
MPAQQRQPPGLYAASAYGSAAASQYGGPQLQQQQQQPQLPPQYYGGIPYQMSGAQQQQQPPQYPPQQQVSANTDACCAVWEEKTLAEPYGEEDECPTVFLASSHPKHTRPLSFPFFFSTTATQIVVCLPSLSPATLACRCREPMALPLPRGQRRSTLRTVFHPLWCVILKRRALTQMWARPHYQKKGGKPGSNICPEAFSPSFHSAFATRFLGHYKAEADAWWLVGDYAWFLKTEGEGAASSSFNAHGPALSFSNCRANGPR